MEGIMEEGKQENKGRECVTGGTGFVASWLIMKLLQHGYSVNATVRSHPPGSKKDLSFLTNQPHAQDRLHIFTADLNDPESFKSAIEGCVGLFHVAHQMDLVGKESVETITEKSIRGMEGILQACIDSKTVKRVVHTSSAAAVSIRESVGDGVLLDEDSWSDVDYMKKVNFFGAAYCISKTLTERAAIEFAKKHGLDIVTVIPTWIHGPFICPNLPGSLHVLQGMILGNENPVKFAKVFPAVHIDDVAEAHIYLFEYPEANGRYICSAVKPTIKELLELISSRYPEFKVVQNVEILSDQAASFNNLSTKKLSETGFRYKYGLEEIYVEAIDCCKKKGFL